MAKRTPIWINLGNLLALFGSILTLSLLASCGAPPAPTTGRESLDAPTTLPNPALRQLQGATSPQVTTPGPTEPRVLEPTVITTLRPGSPVRFASPIIPLHVTAPPEAFFTPTPPPPGATLPLPPRGPMPAIPTHDPQAPGPTRYPTPKEETPMVPTLIFNTAVPEVTLIPSRTVSPGTPPGVSPARTGTPVP